MITDPTTLSLMFLVACAAVVVFVGRTTCAESRSEGFAKLAGLNAAAADRLTRSTAGTCPPSYANKREAAAWVHGYADGANLFGLKHGPH